MALKLVSLLGLCTILFCAWALSLNRRLFPWRTVLWGLALQFFFALFILKTRFGAAIFFFAQRAVNKLSDFSMEGAKMVFGPLANPPLLTEKWGPSNSFIFAIAISATIIVISALSSLFYHWRILPKVVQAMARVMQRTMLTSGSESLAAASNIFLGQTEAALLIKSYLGRMTFSEIMALMTAGMATIASGVMVVYGTIGMDAGHLLTASVMSAPAALLIAKIMVPEIGESETASGASFRTETVFTNSIDALCRGASEGVLMAINVIGMLIAFVAVVALLNFSASWLLRHLFHVQAQTPLQLFFGWINSPFAWLLGIPAKDCLLAGQILGERIVLNEFYGYITLASQQGNFDPRSVTLLTYALCGFANFGSIAIQIGGIGALAPERRGDLARLGLRSMVAGLLACYLTATVVGILL